MTDVEAMFDAVYADPVSATPREALARDLVQLKDPRGEFIELQMRAAQGGKRTREEGAREKALLKAHKDAWLAPLCGALVKSTVKWERGFPVGGRLAFARNADAAEAMIGAQALATLEHLDVEGGNLVRDPGFLHRFLFDSPLRGLKSLTGTYRAQFGDFLSSDPPWSLERLRFATEGGGGPAGEQRMLAQIAEVARLVPTAKGLPHLTELTLSYTHAIDPDGKYGWLWTTDLGRRLRILRMNHRPVGVLPWVQALSEHTEEIALQTIELFSTSSFFLERTKRGWTRLRGALPERELDVKVASGQLHTVRQKLGPDFEIDVPGFEG